MIEFEHPLQRKILKVKEAREFHKEARQIENKTHTFLWEAFDSICSEEQHFEKETTVYSPDNQKFSINDLYIREFLGLRDQKGLTNVLVTLQRSFDLSALSIKLETREGNVAERKSVIFQISKHGTDEEPIWGTRMFIRGVNNDKEISTKLNQPDKSLERLINGLRLLEFINSRAEQSRPQSP